VALVATTLGSVAFQASVALSPDKLRPYSWAVKYLWLTCVALWIIWVLTHPKLGKLWHSDSRPLPPAPNQTINVSPTISTTVSPIITANFNQPAASSLDTRPKITFVEWDTRRETLDLWQSGFVLRNHGEAAFDVTVQPFQITPSMRASSALVQTIAKDSSGFALEAIS
jgi:hypothetical protein